MELSKFNFFKTKYKIVPTYSQDNKRNGYIPLAKLIIGWMPLTMYQLGDDGKIKEIEAFFKTYEDAMAFVKHETSILTDEEILSAKNA